MNDKLKLTKVFNSRAEFVSWLVERVKPSRLTEQQAFIFNKDITTLTKEKLVYKYLKDWYIYKD